MDQRFFAAVDAALEQNRTSDKARSDWLAQNDASSLVNFNAAAALVQKYDAEMQARNVTTAVEMRDSYLRFRLFHKDGEPHDIIVKKNEANQLEVREQAYRADDAVGNDDPSAMPHPDAWVPYFEQRLKQAILIYIGNMPLHQV